MAFVVCRPKGMKRMSFRMPSLRQIQEVGAGFGLVVTFDDRTAVEQAFKGSLASFARLDELVPAKSGAEAPRVCAPARALSHQGAGSVRAAAADLRRCVERRRHAVRGSNLPRPRARGDQNKHKSKRKR